MSWFSKYSTKEEAIGKAVCVSPTRKASPSQTFSSGWSHRPLKNGGSFPGRVTPIDREGATCHEGRFIAREEKCRGRNFGGLRHPLRRMRRDHLFHVLLRIGVLSQPRVDKRRLHPAGTDAINPHASHAMIHGHRASQAQDGMLGNRVRETR